MNVKIAGRHFEMTDALKSYVETGLEKFRGHFNKVIDVDVVLSVEKHRHIAEVNVHANGVRIHGQESSTDMYASVDAVLQKLEKQVRRYKDRINRHQPRHARETRDYHHNVIELLPAAAESSEEMAQTPVHRVVKREKLSTKPMTVEEATMQLDLLEERFLVFMNAETEQLNVLYSREDGSYGLIEPAF